MDDIIELHETDILFFSFSRFICYQGFNIRSSQTTSGEISRSQFHPKQINDEISKSQSRTLIIPAIILFKKTLEKHPYAEYS